MSYVFEQIGVIWASYLLNSHFENLKLVWLGTLQLEKVIPKEENLTISKSGINFGANFISSNNLTHKKSVEFIQTVQMLTSLDLSF